MVIEFQEFASFVRLKGSVNIISGKFSKKTNDRTRCQHNSQVINKTRQGESVVAQSVRWVLKSIDQCCLLYTSDAADE